MYVCVVQSCNIQSVQISAQMGSRSNTLVPQSSSPLKQSSDSGLGGVAFDYSAMPKLVAVHSLSVEDNPFAEEDISGHSEVKSETHSLLPVTSNEKVINQNIFSK